MRSFRITVIILAALSHEAQAFSSALETLAAQAIASHPNISCAWSGPDPILGDGFARFATANGTYSQMALNLPVNGSMAIPRSQLVGLAVDTFDALQVQAAANGYPFSVNYFYFQTPAPNTNLQYLNWTLDRYDCIISSVQMIPSRYPYMQWASPYLPFGYQVFTTLPQPVTLTLKESASFFLKPFSTEMWMFIIGLVVLSTIVTALLEGGYHVNQEYTWWSNLESKKQWWEKRKQGLLDNDREGIFRERDPLVAFKLFEKQKFMPEPLELTPAQQTARREKIDEALRECEDNLEHLRVVIGNLERGRLFGALGEWHFEIRRLGVSAYYAITSLSNATNLTPTTGPGRLYVAGLSVCYLVLVASYTAQLAALFTIQGAAIQTVTSIQQVIAQQLNLCVRNTSSHITFVQQNYPAAKMVIVGNDEVSLANGLLNDVCAAAVTTSPHLKYFLQYNPLGCYLTPVGTLLNQGYYALPFALSNASRSIPASAISYLLDVLIGAGSMDNITQIDFPNNPSQSCSVTSSSAASIQLSIQYFLPLFYLQGAIAVICFFWFIASKIFKARRSRRSRSDERTSSPLRFHPTHNKVAASNGSHHHDKDAILTMKDISDSEVANSPRK